MLPDKIQKRQFHLFQLWFAIPGVLLLVASFYVPVSYLYKQIFWTRAEALSVGQVVIPSGDDAYGILEFTATNGKTYRVESSGDSMFEGSDDKHFLLYYDPENPERFQMLNHGIYAMILFIPFGFFLCYLGWPHLEPVGSRQ